VWSAHISVFKQNYQFSNAQLTIPLFTLALGAILSMPFVGRIFHRIDSSRIAWSGQICYALMLCLLPWARSLMWLAIGTFCFGLLRGTVDVSTNTQAIITERAYGSAVMSGLQGFWSLGGLLGAAFSSVLLRQHATAKQNLFAAAVCMIVTILISKHYLLNEDRPVDPATPMPTDEKSLSDESWRMLLYLAHEDKKQAFRRYADYYLSTNGQLYWSDTHQMSIYPVNYHREIDQKEHAKNPATEIITEINVPREALPSFLAEVRDDFRKNNVELIYGTVRLIEKEDQSFLPWAKQSYACTIFNLHTVHTPEGIEPSAEAFRRLIDMAVKRNGTYYLTYHRYARREQVLACYPNFAEFLKLKKKYDPSGRFQSDWYRHYQAMFGETV